ncbi:hypothetical protein WJX72_009823 [[Myrmecia] bisecta]|uniref:Protein kinase domain-containing protein n=1 Tax=[Myrmecia] bisecta TaxID=41462 RepID=A0AAW1R9L3_9CHLO
MLTNLRQAESTAQPSFTGVQHGRSILWNTSVRIEASLTPGETRLRARQQLRGTAGVLRAIALYDMTTGMLKSVVVISCRGSLTMDDEHEPPPLVDIWNAAAGDAAAAERVREISESLKATAVALLSQVEVFCAPRCIRFFICSNGIWTFFGWYDQPSHMRISQASSMTPATQPSARVFTSSATGPWHPLAALASPGSHSLGRHLALARPPAKPAAEFATPSMDLELVQRAAEFHPDLVEAVLGHGISGDVFKYRFSSGAQTAVKLVARQSDLVKHLVHEADVYLTLRSLWGAQIPVLLAVGEGRAGFVLATELLAGRHIDLRRPQDRGLLPCARAALNAVHGHGVAHNDLRQHNIMVVQNAAGQPTVKLIDFGCSQLNSSSATQQSEMRCLENMFLEQNDPG